MENKLTNVGASPSTVTASFFNANFDENGYVFDGVKIDVIIKHILFYLKVVSKNRMREMYCIFFVILKLNKNIFRRKINTVRLQNLKIKRRV